MENYQFREIAITMNRPKAGHGGTITFCRGNKMYNYSVERFMTSMSSDSYGVVVKNVQPISAADNLASCNGWLNLPTYLAATWFLCEGDFLNCAEQTSVSRLSELLEKEIFALFDSAINTSSIYGDSELLYHYVLRKLLYDAFDQIDFNSIAKKLIQMANATGVEQREPGLDARLTD